MFFSYNRHEVDTRIALHARRSIKPIIITATDTDALVLLTRAYRQCNNAKQRLTKINAGTFIDIKTFCDFFGNGICQILPEFHSITGCDTTSYSFGVGKISPFNKMRRLRKMHKLQDLGKKH